MLTTKEFPPTWPYSIKGNGKHYGPTAKALKRAMKRAGYGFKDKTFAQLTGEFNQKLENALDQWDPGGKDGYGEGRYKKIRKLTLPNGEYALDAYAQNLVRKEFELDQAPPVPNLGPLFHGGASVLNHDLTHRTAGIPLFPAFDDAFRVGTDIIAPERVKVYQQSSSTPGHAFFALGTSKIRWWFGHLDRTPAVGRAYNKGQVMGKVIRNSTGGGPHVHAGLNVELLWGPGKQMAHHHNYTHGAPLIGAQLKAGRAL
jgi:hypothetical protein